jgi:hypothetical protein
MSGARSRPTCRRRLAASLGLVACVLWAVVVGLRTPVALAEAGPPSAPASSNEPSADAGVATSSSSAGRMPSEEDVPSEWLPPGSKASPVPSEEIFPPQTIAIRFDHAAHLGLGVKPKLACPTCHGKALSSDSARDRLLPNPVVTCDPCHGTSHRDLEQVRPGSAADGQCPSCHLGKDAGRDGLVTRFVLPRPNLRNSHRKHLARNIGCAQCHGSVEKIGLGTRQQLPRMSGCFVCHAMSGPARGEARGPCITCHLVAPGGRLQTTFATGRLVPPPWLHGADHGSGWAIGHRRQAAANSAMARFGPGRSIPATGCRCTRSPHAKTTRGA